jgi:gluconolactonase
MGAFCLYTRLWFHSDNATETNMKYLLHPFLAIACAAQMLAVDSTIIAPGAVLKKLAGDFDFTEGPASDREGNVFFTDQPNDRILKWSVDGKLSTFMHPCGRANGLCFDREGNLWACADENNELWRIAPSGKVTVVVKDYHGKLLNGPNDVWVQPNRLAKLGDGQDDKAPKRLGTLGPAAQTRGSQEIPGGLYFTDPYYKRPWWQRGPKEMTEGVYYLAPDQRTLRRVIDDLKQPNGIIGTPDGKLLYVADIGAGRTYRYAIVADGSLKEKKLFCELGSDGMTIDSQGNIYLTGKGVSVFDPAGQKIEQIEVPESWTANVCFGGKDRQTLFITASKGLYSLDMAVHGVDSQ